MRAHPGRSIRTPLQAPTGVGAPAHHYRHSSGSRHLHTNNCGHRGRGICTPLQAPSGVEASAHHYARPSGSRHLHTTMRAHRVRDICTPLCSPGWGSVFFRSAHTRRRNRARGSQSMAPFVTWGSARQASDAPQQGVTRTNVVYETV